MARQWICDRGSWEALVEEQSARPLEEVVRSTSLASPTSFRQRRQALAACALALLLVAAAVASGQLLVWRHVRAPGQPGIPVQAAPEAAATVQLSLETQGTLRGADAAVAIAFEMSNYTAVFPPVDDRPGRLSHNHRTVTLSGFSRPELNARYTERFGLDYVVSRLETFWTLDLAYYLYYCEAAEQWIIGWGEDNFQNIRANRCDYTAKAPVGLDILDPNKPRGGWTEWIDGQLVAAPAAGVDILSTQEWLEAKGDGLAYDSLDAYPHCKRPPYNPIDYFRVYTGGLSHREELTSNTDYNQGSCNDCWAVTVAELVARLLCITSNRHWEGPRAFLSPGYITSCAVPALVSPEDGCRSGGRPLQALWWIGSHGVPTGGNSYSDQTCIPFFHVNKTSATRAPACPTSCTKDYPRTLAQDLFTPEGLKYTYQTSALESALKAMKSGPIAIIIPLYEDFYDYKGGTYEHKTGKRLGNHVMVAHGYEKGYIIGFNSWGTAWGYVGNYRIPRELPIAFIIPGKIKGRGPGYPYPLPSSVRRISLAGFENAPVNGVYEIWLNQVAEVNEHETYWKNDRLMMYWCPQGSFWAVTNLTYEIEFNMKKKGWRKELSQAAGHMKQSLRKECRWLAHSPVLPSYISLPALPDMYFKGWFENGGDGMALVRPLAGIQERS